MAETRFFIPRLPAGNNNILDLINNLLIPNLNKALQEVELVENRATGQGGNTAKISSNLDMSGQRVTNAHRSEAPDDCVTRRELQELGIYNPNPGRDLEVNKLTVKNKLTLRGAPVINKPEVKALIDTTIGIEVPTISDGQSIDLEDISGVDGKTKGTLLFGAGPSNKARPVRVNTGGAVVLEDPRTSEQLERVIYLLEELLNKFGSE